MHPKYRIHILKKPYDFSSGKMSSSKRRKTDNYDSDIKPKEPITSCILHATGIQHGQFTPFSRVKGSAGDKLTYLQTVCEKRLQEHTESPCRMTNICDMIPSNLDGIDLDTTGYHRGCYQHFIKNLDRLSSGSVPPKESSHGHSPRKSLSSENRVFPPECIFCEKCDIKINAGKSRRTERCTTFPVFQESYGGLKGESWRQIEPRALEMCKMRLHRLVQGEDLFAREAKFHKTCLSSFKLDYLSHCRKQIKEEECPSTSEQDPNTTAHEKAFDLVLHFLQKHVVTQKEVVLHTTIHKIYLQELQILGVVEPVYSSSNPRRRLENHEISAHIAFTKVDPGNAGFRRYNLIYNSSLSVSEAVGQAYQLGSKDALLDTANLLRGIIQKAFSDSTPLPWPPTADDLDKDPQEQLPHDILKFLNFVVTGSTDIDSCEKTKRVVLSIGQVNNIYINIKYITH